MVHTQGQALCVAHASTVCEEDVRALLPFLHDPERQRVFVIPVEAEGHLRTPGHVLVMPVQSAGLRTQCSVCQYLQSCH
jgi:hypothetical protein